MHAVGGRCGDPGGQRAGLGDSLLQKLASSRLLVGKYRAVVFGRVELADRGADADLSEGLSASLSQLEIGFAFIKVNVIIASWPWPRPAWTDKRSWYMIAEEDRVIPVATQLFLSQRTKARVRSEKFDHTPLLTAPDAVVDVIVEAASWQ